MLQVVHQSLLGQHRRLHAGVKKAQLVSPQGFGAVHGAVGFFQHIAHRLGHTQKHHRADAQRGLKAVALQVKVLLHRQQNLLRHAVGLAHRVRLWLAQGVEQHHKLVAAKSGHTVALAHTQQQPLADLLQQQVAHIVAQGVVDLLETVNVQEHQRAVVVGARRGQPRLVEPVHQQTPVGQPGEGVVQRI